MSQKEPSVEERRFAAQVMVFGGAAVGALAGAVVGGLVTLFTGWSWVTFGMCVGGGSLLGGMLGVSLAAATGAIHMTPEAIAQMAKDNERVRHAQYASRRMTYEHELSRFNNGHRLDMPHTPMF